MNEDNPYRHPGGADLLRRGGNAHAARCVAGAGRPKGREAMTSVPDRLRTAESELAESFAELHRENNAWRQNNPHLREAVAACSAALAQVRRAIGHAEQVYATEEKL